MTHNKDPLRTQICKKVPIATFSLNKDLAGSPDKDRLKSNSRTNVGKSEVWVANKSKEYVSMDKFQSRRQCVKQVETQAAPQGSIF